MDYHKCCGRVAKRIVTAQICLTMHFLGMGYLFPGEVNVHAVFEIIVDLSYGGR